MRDLKQIISEHEKYLENVQDGKRLEYMKLSQEEQELFKNANLENVNLSKANLEYANLKCAYLKGANLEYSNLSNANLKGANLKGSDLTYANLNYTILTDANLKGVNLDFSTGFSLDCSGLGIKLDEEHIYQYLYHLSSSSQHLELENELRYLLTKYGNKWKDIDKYDLEKIQKK